jgi:hypothetical protein
LRICDSNSMSLGSLSPTMNSVTKTKRVTNSMSLGRPFSDGCCFHRCPPPLH